MTDGYRLSDSAVRLLLESADESHIELTRDTGQHHIRRGDVLGPRHDDEIEVTGERSVDRESITVTVEDRAIVGGLAAVHQFCRIGKMAIIGGCSKVVQDVPPFMLADGNPAETRTVNKVGLERNGVSEECQNALRQAYKILFREGLTVSNAVAKIEIELPKLPEVVHLVQFIRSSQRGISK